MKASESILRKVTNAISVTAFLAILLVASILSLIEWNQSEEAIRREVYSLATVMARNATASLEFDDKDAATQTLSSLQDESLITEAAIYDKDGNLFATYPSSGALVPSVAVARFTRGDRALHQTSGRYLEYYVPIGIDGRIIGALFARADRRQIYSGLLRYLGAVGAILVVVGTLALLISRRLSGVISAPIIELTEVAKRVAATRDYTIRAEARTDDETGLLVSHFNEMLAHLADRNEAVSRSAEQLEELADSMPQIVWTSDSEGRPEYFNRRWFEYTGLMPDEAFDEEKLAQVIHPDDRASYRDVLGRSQRENMGFSLEYRLRNRAGEYRWHLARAVAASRDGRISRWYATATDIHDQKELSRQMEEAHRRKDEFLAMLGHELRNPLSAIVNAVAIARRPGGESRLAWAMSVMDRQLGNLKRLIDDLLDVSRITRGKIELKRDLIDVAIVLERAIEAMRPAIEAKEQVLSLDFHCCSLWCRGDATRLEQVFHNLLSNANKYTPAGGKIFVSCCQSGERITVRVRDTGIGIPKGSLRNIFELFAQGERSLARSEGGLGIGLTVVESLVSLHGGKIEALSDGAGKGSEFVIDLPGLAPGERPEAPAERAAQPSPRGVLIVDDNVDGAQALSFALQDLGYRNRIVHNGWDALAEIRRSPPRILLLDIGLPGLDGYQVAERIRRDLPDAKILIVALTGYGNEEDRERSRKAGIDVHLVKPVDPEQIHEILASRLAEAV